MSGDRRVYAPIIGTGLLALLSSGFRYSALPAFGWLPPYDDAYITLTSAQALWSGAIPNYPDTPALYGITSPAHLLLVALFLPVATSITALWWSQLAAACLYAAALWALARAWALSPIHATLVVLIGLTAGMIPHHLFNGLETGLSLAALTWALALARRQAPYAPILFGALPFVRPEFAVIAAALTLWWFWNLPRQQWIGTAALVMLGALPFVLLMLWQLGGILPTSAPTKTAFLTERCFSGSVKASLAIWAVASWVLAVGPCVAGFAGITRDSLVRVATAAFALTLVVYALGLPSQLPHYHHQRYLYAWCPVVLAGGLALVHRLRTHVSAVLAVVTVVGVARLPATWHVHSDWNRAFQTEQRQLINWLAANVPADSRLMVIDAGFLAFATDYRLVDAVGLKTPASSDTHRVMTLPSCGRDRGRALAQIARTSHATHFVSWGEWDGGLHLSDQLRAAGASLEPVRPRPITALGPLWYPVYRLSRADR